MAVLLLVEGKKDAEVLAQLIKKAGLGSCHYHPTREEVDFVIKPLDSYESLRREIPAELTSTEYDRFGIIPDADENLLNRWQSLASKLIAIEERSTRLFDTLPDSPSLDGTVLLSQTGRLVGLWLWPDNRQSDSGSIGDLEAFTGQLVPQNDTLWIYAQATLAGLPERRFRTNHANKAQIHTWLAWQDPPDQTIGIAIAKGNLRIDHAPATRLIVWLTKLKEEPTT